MQKPIGFILDSYKNEKIILNLLNVDEFKINAPDFVGYKYMGEL